MSKTWLRVLRGRGRHFGISGGKFGDGPTVDEDQEAVLRQRLGDRGGTRGGSDSSSWSYEVHCVVSASLWVFRLICGDSLRPRGLEVLGRPQEVVDEVLFTTVSRGRTEVKV